MKLILYTSICVWRTKTDNESQNETIWKKISKEGQVARSNIHRRQNFNCYSCDNEQSVLKTLIALESLST